MVKVLTALAVLSGCGDEGRGDRDAGVDPGFGPATYVVTGVTEDGRPRTLVRGTEIRIRFADGRITLTAGCNTMGGEYTLEESRLTVRDLATTDMGCDQARMEQDTWLGGLFAEPVQFMPGDEASIVSGSTVLTLADREKVSPDRPLVGTKWLLDSIGEGGADGAVSSVPEGVVAYLTFEDGQVLLYDGCNGGSAPVTVDGGSIVFGDRTQTLRACTREPVAQVEGAVHAVLDGTARFEIEERTLTISKGDRVLGFRAVQEFPEHD
jgi:heat shock protein HslJ